MSIIPLRALAEPQNWPTSVLILLFATAVIVLSRLVLRPTWPSSAPKYLPGWPVIGSPDFFRERWSFIQRGISMTSTGQFSFFYGPHSIVALSGATGRRTFFTSRSLDLNEGFASLFTAGPSIDHLYKGEGTITAHFFGLFKRFLHRDLIEANLHNLVNDCVSSFEKLDTKELIDPFNDLYRLVYQLTLRTLGTNDVADDPKLLDETLKVFTTMDDSSALEVMFPKLPIPSRLRKMWAGAKLHMTFSKIMQDRQRTGRVETDAMQAMMDAGDSDVVISGFIMAALFAGLINTGVNAAWILLYLSNNKEWYHKVRDEVEACVAKHRYSETESRIDIMSRLPLDVWENEFPVIDLCLRESIRLTMPGSSFRKNTSGKDVVIADSGEIIPKDSFAIYPIADIHLNPDIYPEPHKWDPSRYTSDRAEDKKESHAYVGWGTGLHPCLGMKFAKLEMAICTAMFVAFFDFDLVDKEGNSETARLPLLNHNNLSAIRQPGVAFLKCNRRQ